jgi:hypothetical protein
MKLGMAFSVILCFIQVVTEAEAIRLKALPSTVRVRQEGPVSGADAAEIFCARGETESFQVVVMAADRNLQNISAWISPLKNEANESIPANNVRIYREVFIPIRYSSPGATVPPGLIADPLVPFVDPYAGKEIRDPRWRDEKLEGARFGGLGFDIWQGRGQPLWVDVQIPKETAPGLYSGTFTVRADNETPVTVPVRVTV